MPTLLSRSTPPGGAARAAGGSAAGGGAAGLRGAGRFRRRIARAASSMVAPMASMASNLHRGSPSRKARVMLEGLVDTLAFALVLTGLLQLPTFELFSGAHGLSRQSYETAVLRNLKAHAHQIFKFNAALCADQRCERVATIGVQVARDCRLRLRRSRSGRCRMLANALAIHCQRNCTRQAHEAPVDNKAHASQTNRLHMKLRPNRAGLATRGLQEGLNLCLQLLRDANFGWCRMRLRKLAFCC
mmetsp:Transcript_5088/g.19038  ORF Transcript_5088/g.19038 Transcript_5088/m.19038 type:complete len:244 (+) Transcript_5088:765-1496(+)